MKIRKLLLGFILIVGLFQSESMAQINYYINSQGIPINASAVEAKQRLANGENYLGEIRAYPSNTNPSSWIRADGRLLNINQYLPLYGMLQNRYGGDGINTFAVPKLVPIDADDSTNNVNWSIGGDKLKAIGLLGSLNNYNVQFIRNNVNQFSLTSTGIVSNVDYTTSGNVTLQKGNPRIRMRDVGSGNHTNGFDLHVNGDEFSIDDNTDSRNILRNYLNSTVHTTDFDAEVFNFKNGTTNYARLNATSLNLPYLTPSQLVATDASDNLVSLSTATYPSLAELAFTKGLTSNAQSQINGKFNTPTGLTTNILPKWSGTALVNSLLVDDGTNINQNSANNTNYNVQRSGVTYVQLQQNAGGGFLGLFDPSSQRNVAFRAYGNTELNVFTGNTGIGTASPIFKLDVNGGAEFGAAYIGLPNGTLTNTLNFGYTADNDTQDGWINFAGFNGGNTRFRNFQIGNGRNTAIMSFVGATGRVGIGTTSPQQRQHNNITVGGVGVGLMLSNDATNATAGRGIGVLFAGTGNANLAQIEAQTLTASDNTGGLIFRTANAGTLTERMRIDQNGSVGIGTASLTGVNLSLFKNITGGINSQNFLNQGVVQSDVTNSAKYVSVLMSTQAATFTLPNLVGYEAAQGIIGSGNTVNAQYGFWARESLIGATLNYGFRSNIPSATGRWNLFMDGTAQNFISGNLGIGIQVPTDKLDVDGTGHFTGVVRFDSALRLPQLTTTQINAIASPVNGMLVYNTTLNKICVYENTAWRQVTTTAM